MSEMVVERINGVEISHIRDVVRAVASPQGRFHVIETDYHKLQLIAALRTKSSSTASPSDRSPNLR
jgi:hypothetical protein